MTINRILFWITLGMIATCVLLLGHRHGWTHEIMPGDPPEVVRVKHFYQTWLRPKGDFAGIQHRVYSCCYAEGALQDCFPVFAERRDAEGILEIQLDAPDTSYYHGIWYKVQHGIEEHNQPDPRESPDGRSHACVAGTMVICFVQGAGS
jgi:hypothetical protein